VNLESKATLLVCGGGTGGHVLAGIALANEWQRQHGMQARVCFVGAKGGLEEKLVPRAGYPLRLLELGALNRVGIVRKIKTLFQMPVCLFRAALILFQERPSAVIGVGGYASGPMLLVASFFRLNTAILEQNSVPGLTNRWLGHLVRKIFTAFEGTQGFSASKVLVTGNPIRTEFQVGGSATRRPFVIFIFGGSQGAMGLNSLVLDSLPYLVDRGSDIEWIHQTGEKDFDRVKAGFETWKGLSPRIEKFIYEMPECYKKASLVICRAGSSTLSEIAAVGRAALFIPLPTAADNHQVKNAEIFQKAGASLMLQQNQTSGKELAKVIGECIANPSLLEKMEKAVVGFYKPSAAEMIIKAIKSVND
jgi:UDP-N-acetylglucosamine--N-acetylmuramyl-(pentapeptide) pyrophosphoryl-undecaprenol N-acetylglucosamine transferase